MKLSVIIPIKNQIDLTRVCIDSLKKYTLNQMGGDCEVIIINDGSDEETNIYLNNVVKNTIENCTILNNPSSLGYTKSANKGLNIAKGEYVVITNNDVVFTPSWHTKMINLFEKDTTLGILGPTTNKITNEQSIDRNTTNTKFQYTNSLIFFCVMVRRSVIQSIGLLDERFSPGGQEDSAYCIRAWREGWNIGIARDVFLYHYGSLTFRKEFNNDVKKSVDYAKSRINILKNNYINKKKIFIAIPNRGGLVPGLVRNLFIWAKDPRYDIEVFMPEGVFPLDNARNTIVKEFLELDYDYLWWIDDDIVPPIHTLDKLIEANKDVVGAACFSMKADKGEYFPYPVTLRYNDERRYQVHYGAGLEEVDAIGGACVLVKRKVYEQIERPYEFVYHKDGTLALTCDFRIWQKWQALGGKVYVDFNILCDHQKKCSIKGIQDLLNTKLNNKKEG